MYPFFFSQLQIFLLRSFHIPTCLKRKKCTLTNMYGWITLAHVSMYYTHTYVYVYTCISQVWGMSCFIDTSYCRSLFIDTSYCRSLFICLFSYRRLFHPDRFFIHTFGSLLQVTFAYVCIHMYIPWRWRVSFYIDGYRLYVSFHS